MPGNLTILDKFTRTPTSAAATRAPFQKINYTGNFGAIVAETQDDILDMSPYRSITVSVTGSAWGVGTVLVKIYPCDSQGNIMSVNPFFIVTLTANATTVLIISEMGGAVSAAVYPPATPPSTGSIVGPIGNWVKLTTQMTAFTSGTNTVAVELGLKG